MLTSTPAKKSENGKSMKGGDEKAEPGKVLTSALPELSETEEFEEEEDGRGEKGKDMSVEKGKKLPQEKKWRIVHQKSEGDKNKNGNKVKGGMKRSNLAR